VVGKRGQRHADGRGVLDARQRVVDGGRVDPRRSAVGGAHPSRCPQPVDRDPPRDLPDPRPDCRVVPQPTELLVDPHEHLLSDVLDIGWVETVAARRDRVDITREPLDELGPGDMVIRSATGDESDIALVARPAGNKSRRWTVLLRIGRIGRPQAEE